MVNTFGVSNTSSPTRRGRTRVFLLQADRVACGATTAMLEELGYVVARVSNDLQNAAKLSLDPSFDFALLERELGDGTDATPVAELLSARGIPYAFIIEPGDPARAESFPGVPQVRKPLSPLDLNHAISEATTRAGAQS